MSSPSRNLSFVFLAVALAISACDAKSTGNDGGESRTLIVYSGRSESLVGPLLDMFEAETGIRTEVRYGGTSELAATLLEEGANSPADVFLSQDAAALGALSASNRFLVLEPELLETVPAHFRSPRGDWIGLSGRARTVVYEPSRIAVAELPASLEALADEAYRGRFGVAPTNGSFQAHMTVYGVAAGEEALDRLLTAMAGNDPQAYPKNSAIVEAVIAGEIDFGLVNHYYLWRAKKEDPTVTARNFFMSGPASSFINAAGVGVLSESPEARRLVAYLLSEEAQRYFSEQTYEYPLAGSVPPSVQLPPLASVGTPDVDYAKVSAGLESTLQAIDRSGLIR